jgi:hypothetical protein
LTLEKGRFDENEIRSRHRVIEIPADDKINENFKIKSLWD